MYVTLCVQNEDVICTWQQSAAESDSKMSPVVTRAREAGRFDAVD